MGKKRIPDINDFESGGEPQKKVHLGRKDEHQPKKKGRLTDIGELALEEMETVESKTEKLTTPAVVAADTPRSDTNAEKPAKPSGRKKIRLHRRSRRYQSVLKKVDRTKLYPVAEAVQLLCQLPHAKYDETVEVHINTIKDKVAGEVKLPHGTGRTQKIVIFSENLLKELDKGKMGFDLLLARPADMPKLAKYAKILGPKGLFPNPKNGTISADPEKTAKEMAGGKTHFKTEPKAALIHFVIGKLSFGENKLKDNLLAFIKAVGPTQIGRAVLTSSQSPGIKLQTK